MTEKKKTQSMLDTEKTHELCEQLAPLLEGQALPMEEPSYVYYSPMPCQIQLDTQVQGHCPIISIRVLRQKPTHVVVYGEWPESKLLNQTFSPYGGERVRITSSRMKPVQRIATQIARRFLPGYLQQFENCMLDLKDAERTHLKAIATINAIGERIEVGRDSRRTDKRVYDDIGSNSVEFFCTGDQCRISITCDEEVALSVAAMWKVIKQTAKEKEDSNND